MGERTVQLGEQIIKARVDLNDSLTAQGERHPSSIEAQAKLELLNQSAQNLFK